VIRWWSALSVRWKLVALNAVVVVVSGVTVLMLVHHIGVPNVDTVMHDAGSAPTPAMAQDAYQTAVDRQVVPAVVIAAFIAIVLNLVVVTTALRPLRDVRTTTRRIVDGDLAARVATRRRDDIGEVARSVDDMAAHLERLEELRRRSTDDVAHELRTPLQNILGLVEAMRDGVVPSDASSLDRVHAEVMRLTTLVDDLRRLADAQSARDHLHRKDVRLAALCREVVRGFDNELAVRQLTGRVLTPDGRDVDVHADPGRLAQVVSNLVANATRYARPESSIDIVVRASGTSAHVDVVDEGHEIPQAVMPFIFERFIRADPSRGRGGGGTGVGLAIVKELVEAHGGSVGATSADGRVVVWFEVPAQRDREARAAPRAQSSVSTAHS
jgi:two-component system sensor histidine kinase BaeS